MLGLYENFPRSLHAIESFNTSFSTRHLQNTIIQTLYKLNTGIFNLEEIVQPSMSSCETIFEFGVADARDFVYLGREERRAISKALSKEIFRLMDFFCCIRYYKPRNERKIPLRFDYYMLRFAFEAKLVEIQIFHERGPRHISPEQLTGFLVQEINHASSRKILRETC